MIDALEARASAMLKAAVLAQDFFGHWEALHDNAARNNLIRFIELVSSAILDAREEKAEPGGDDDERCPECGNSWRLVRGMMSAERKACARIAELERERDAANEHARQWQDRKQAWKAAAEKAEAALAELRELESSVAVLIHALNKNGMLTLGRDDDYDVTLNFGDNRAEAYAAHRAIVGLGIILNNKKRPGWWAEFIAEGRALLSPEGESKGGATCEYCNGTGQPNGIKGGPEHGNCAYCNGTGSVPQPPRDADPVPAATDEREAAIRSLVHAAGRAVHWFHGRDSVIVRTNLKAALVAARSAGITQGGEDV